MQRRLITPLHLGEDGRLTRVVILLGDQPVLEEGLQVGEALPDALTRRGHAG